MIDHILDMIGSCAVGVGVTAFYWRGRFLKLKNEFAGLHEEVIGLERQVNAVMAEAQAAEDAAKST